jgi:trigger factor
VGGRLREIARTARIKGFRPGKVPTKVIEQRYGDQVRSEILNGMLRESFDNAIRENALRLAGSPQIEPSTEAAGEGELAYVATFEVVPDFGDVDVSALEVVRHTAPGRGRGHRSHDRQPPHAAPELDARRARRQGR